MFLDLPRDDFQVWNILPPDSRPGTWDADFARRVVDNHLWPWIQKNLGHGDRLLLMGRRVEKAFSIEGGPYAWGSLVGHCVVPMMLIPHPSGRSHFWNQPDEVGRVTDRVREFLAPLGVTTS